MEEPILEVERREAIGKNAARKLRRQGKIPAVIYGGDIPPRSLMISQEVISDVLKRGEINKVFKLKIKGVKKTRYAMIHDLQRDPITHQVLHVDLLRVLLDQAVTVTVPIHLEGISPGVKAGGILDFSLRELEISCLPTQIPPFIPVDIGSLHVGDNLKVEDLALPEGVRAVTEEHAVVVRIAEPRAAEVVEVAEAEEEVEPEVVGKGKEEESEA